MAGVIGRWWGRWLALALGALYLGLFLVSLVLLWRVAQTAVVGGVAIANVISELLTAGAFLAIGVLIATRRPDNRIGWLLGTIGLVWCVVALIDSVVSYGFSRWDGGLGDAAFLVWVGTSLAFLGICLIVPFTLLLFPSGRLPSARWRWVAALAVVGTLCATVAFAIEPGASEVAGLPDRWQVENPYGWDHAVMRALFLLGLPLVAGTSIASAVSIVQRLRRARGVERQQLVWIAYAGALVAVGFGLNFVANVVESVVPGVRDIGLIDATAVVQHLAFTAFPIVVGIAILRHRLFDIDLLIKRTLVYGVLSICLVIVYVIAVVASEWLVRRTTGQGSSLAVAASTLAVAALFQPLRGRIQSSVDRRFYRRKYDAARTLDAFSARLRDEVDLATLTDDLRQVVDETMQPSHVSLWLRSP
jgi:hypothetical protein